MDLNTKDTKVSPPIIKSVEAKEIRDDNYGHFAMEVTVHTSWGVNTKTSVLFRKNQKKKKRKTINNVNTIICPKLIGKDLKDPSNQRDIDKLLVQERHCLEKIVCLVNRCN